MGTKMCRKCFEEKSIDNFTKDKKRKDGLDNCCRDCKKQRYIDNKESISINKKQYYQNNKENLSEKRKVYYVNNKENILIIRKQYRKDNKEIIKVNSKQYSEDNREKLDKYYKQYREDNRESILKKNSLYSKENTDKGSIIHQRRKTRKKSLPATLTVGQWNDVKENFSNCCCYCGRKLPLEMEHFISLANKGGFTKENILPSCKPCNSSKGSKFFFEWYPKYRYYSKKRETKILKYLNYKNETQQLTLTI